MVNGRVGRLFGIESIGILTGGGLGRVLANALHACGMSSRGITTSTASVCEPFDVASVMVNDQTAAATAG